MGSGLVIQCLARFRASPQPCQRPAHTGSADGSRHQSLLETDLCRQWQTPQAALDAELARAAMQQVPSGGQVLVGNAGAQVVRATGCLLEHGQSRLAEAMDDVANGPRVAAQAPGH